MTKLKLLDTFAGIGGFSYAAEKIVGGYETTKFIEINPFSQKILKKHWPSIPIHDDITTFTAKSNEFDVICGGFPCQDISVAGLQKGITKETRSGLFYELMRVIRMVRPKYVILENVAAILANGLGVVLGELSKAGYSAEWSIISASSLGACHQRSRWWLVAYPNSERVEGRIMEIGQELQIQNNFRKKNSFRSTEFTNTYNNGSSSTEKFRINEETSDRTSQGQNKISQPQRSSESRSDKSFQSVSNTTNTNSFRTQGNCERLESPIWSNAFLNSKERRTLGRDWTRYVSKPCLCRGDDGLRGRVDRLKSLGNSVVPQVAAIPLQRVHDLYYNE